MKITHFAHVNNPPEAVAAAAKAWLIEESEGIEPTITRDAENRQLLMIETEVDCVLITTGYIVSPADTGTDVRFLLEMRGTTMLSRFRNLGMNIARKVVAQGTEASFRHFIDELTESQ
ncbi:MAG: hypothetical protein KC435_10915 [Thermomicrobiales bacterium]|nr:hypothetical protein [Thermomicrobiales bacterium]